MNIFVLKSTPLVHLLLTYLKLYVSGSVRKLGANCIHFQNKTSDFSIFRHFNTIHYVSSDISLSFQFLRCYETHHLGPSPATSTASSLPPAQLQRDVDSVSHLVEVTTSFLAGKFKFKLL